MSLRMDEEAVVAVVLPPVSVSGEGDGQKMAVAVVVAVVQASPEGPRMMKRPALYLWPLVAVSLHVVVVGVVASLEPFSRMPFGVEAQEQRDEEEEEEEQVVWTVWKGVKVLPWGPLLLLDGMIYFWV